MAPHEGLHVGAAHAAVHHLKESLAWADAWHCDLAHLKLARA